MPGAIHGLQTTISSLINSGLPILRKIPDVIGGCAPARPLCELIAHVFRIFLKGKHVVRGSSVGNWYSRFWGRAG